jgi:hypothetical protein
MFGHNSLAFIIEGVIDRKYIKGINDFIADSASNFLNLYSVCASHNNSHILLNARELCPNIIVNRKLLIYLAKVVQTKASLLIYDLTTNDEFTIKLKNSTIKIAEHGKIIKDIVYNENSKILAGL